MEQRVEFYSEGQKVVGRFQSPARGAPCIVMSHGFESSMDGAKWTAFPLWFFEHGFATLKFNYRGCGEGDARSEGKFEDTTLTARLKDYHAALDFLEGTGVDMGRVGVIGSSFGGMIALASEDDRVKVLVTLATPCEFPLPPDEELNKELEHAQEQRLIELPSGRRLRVEFFSDIKRYDIWQRVRKMRQPLLIIHGSCDELVPVENAYQIYDNANEPRKLEILEGADHSFTDPRWWDKLMALSLDWFRRYL